MSRLPAVLFVAAILSPGCVPVTEPVGDPEKAAADQALAGTWKDEGGKDAFRIEPKGVAGNPKGLMRMVFIENSQEVPVWFFVATVGKEKYGNLCMDATDRGAAVFTSDGDYAAWAKGTGRRYFVFRYAVEKDTLVINFGNKGAFRALMDAEKIEEDNKSCFKTPAGWLAKHLEKNGPGKIFPAGDDKKMIRKK